MSIAELKKRRQQMMDKLKDANSSTGGKDERFWKPTFDKEKGTGRATIRFLDAPIGEDLPYTRVYSRSFKGPTGKYYGENDLSTLNQKDPVGDLCSRLWNSGVESDQNVARGMKRNTSYYSNILVIEDPANPENEGKVFLYRYGPMIHKIVQQRIFPDPDLNEYDDNGINVYDLWEGADFQIRIQAKVVGKDKVPNYEKSSFKAPSAVLGGDDDRIEDLMSKCHSLKQFTDPSKFKSEEDLKKRLFEVLGPTVGSGVDVIEGWAAPAQEAPSQQRQSAPAPRAKEVESVLDDSSPFADDDSDMQELMSLID